MDNLQELWQKQADPIDFPSRPLESVTAAQKTIERKVFVRDLIEWSISLFMAYRMVADSTRYPQAQGLFLACAVLVIFPMGYASLRTYRARQQLHLTTLPLAESLKASVQWLTSQVALLRAVGWWCLLPLSVMVYLTGPYFFPNPKALLLHRLACVAVFALVYRLNQKAADQLEEQRNQLQVVVEELDQNDLS